MAETQSLGDDRLPGGSVEESEEGGREQAGRTKAVGEPAGVTAARLAAELAEARAELDQTKALAEQRLGMAQRSQADYQNLKKRAAQETLDRSGAIAERLLAELLPLVDDVERALASDVERDPAAWLQGVQMIQQNFFHYLEQMDIHPIAAEGQPFDPNFHEAVGEVAGPAGQVMTQVQKGYLLGRRVLRPARVLVGRDASAAPESDNDAAQP